MVCSWLNHKASKWRSLTAGYENILTVLLAFLTKIYNSAQRSLHYTSEIPHSASKIPCNSSKSPDSVTKTPQFTRRKARGASEALAIPPKKKPYNTISQHLKCPSQNIYENYSSNKPQGIFKKSNVHTFSRISNNTQNILQNKRITSTHSILNTFSQHL